MIKSAVLGLMLLGCVSAAKADTNQYMEYFKVNMTEMPKLEELLKSLDRLEPPQYDRGYTSRFNMDNKFKKEFGKTISSYGKSEGRIKKYYEDDLLEVLSWMPKSTYQYIGPMLYEVPGMPEKILNMPGIKETKNQFPKDVDEKYSDVEDIEYMSPSLYILLMPRELRIKEAQNMDAPVKMPAKKVKPLKDIPTAIKIKAGVGIDKKMIKKQNSTESKVKNSSKIAQNIRTIFPTATSPLTIKDAKAIMESFDDINNWGRANDMENFSKLMMADIVLGLWEEETGNNQVSGNLKDIVNPCQRLVVKMHLSGLYNEFINVVAKQGFSPEEWAYTCDKSIKAFRVAEANHEVAYAVRFHRRGYFHQYINRLPKKWREQMLATEAAIIAMYTVLKEDVDAIRPIKNEFLRKVIENNGMLLTAPIFY